MKKIECFDENELILKKVKRLLKEEMNSISFNVWIKDLEIESIDDEKINLIVHSDKQKEALERRFYVLLFHTFKYVTKKERKIEAILK